MEITYSIPYRGLQAQQSVDFFEVFDAFLSRIIPVRIVEIGTSNGGFILAIRDIMDKVNKDCVIRSYDVYEHGSYDLLRLRGVDIRLENVFDGDMIEVKKFIQSEGTTLVLCDGGNKIREFNALAPFLKPDDFIMAHDYAETRELFNESILNKRWNWCEITADDIEAISLENDLIRVNAEEFQSIAWVCKAKRGTRWTNES